MRLPGARARGVGDDAPRRPARRTACDYWFLTHEEFDRRVADGEFLEWVDVRRQPLRDAALGDRPHPRPRRGAAARPRDRGRAAGARRGPGSRHVFVDAPLPELERRLRERATESAGEIDERLELARRQQEQRDEFDHVSRTTTRARRGRAGGDRRARAGALPLPWRRHDPSPHRRTAGERRLALRARDRRGEARPADQQLPPPARRGHVRRIPAAAGRVALEELPDHGPGGNRPGQDRTTTEPSAASALAGNRVSSRRAEGRPTSLSTSCRSRLALLQPKPHGAQVDGRQLAAPARGRGPASVRRASSRDGRSLSRAAWRRSTRSTTAAASASVSSSGPRSSARARFWRRSRAERTRLRSWLGQQVRQRARSDGPAARSTSAISASSASSSVAARRLPRSAGPRSSETSDARPRTCLPPHARPACRQGSSLSSQTKPIGSDPRPADDPVGAALCRTRSSPPAACQSDGSTRSSRSEKTNASPTACRSHAPPAATSSRRVGTMALARILLGVTGGIAAYKACELVRLLVQAGHEVVPLVTPGADRFVRRETFAALARRPRRRASPYPHLSAPTCSSSRRCTANTLAKLAHGLADNVLTEAALAHRGPILVAPAMNPRMWAHPATQANVETLRERGVELVGPGRGRHGRGRVGRRPHGRAGGDLRARAEQLLGAAGPLDGPRVLVTAGGTREPLDAVRFLGNRSSGRMGVALAEEARRRGAEVTLLAANLAVPAPAGVEVVETPTASRRWSARRSRATRRRPRRSWPPPSPTTGPPRRWRTKRPKDASAWTLELEPTTDVARASSAARRTNGQVLVGFAAEHGERRARARAARSSPTKGSTSSSSTTCPAPTSASTRRQRGRARLARRASGASAKAPKEAIAAAILDEVERPAGGAEWTKRSAASASTVAPAAATIERDHRQPRARRARAGETLRLCVLCLVSEGHLIIEDFPGVGKTMLAKALARSLDCSLLAPPVHARPAAVRRHRRERLRPAHERVRVPARARCSPTCCSSTRSTAPRRRRSPRCSSACRRTRSRSTATTYELAAAVHGHRDAEPDRVRGHVPAARGAARPLHDAARARLPAARRRRRGC